MFAPDGARRRRVPRHRLGVAADAADAAATHAHAPYSGLHVGAAGLAADGAVVAACNVENASYGLTLCAECGLVSALVAGGHGRLVAVSVTAGDGRPLAPCGRCRQVLLEHGGPELLLDAGDGPRARHARRDAARAPSTPRSSSPAGLDERRGAHHDVVDVIRTKRDGGELDDDAIDWVLDAYVRGDGRRRAGRGAAHGRPL